VERRTPRDEAAAKLGLLVAWVQKRLIVQNQFAAGIAALKVTFNEKLASCAR